MMRNCFLLLMLFFSFKCFSQVGVTGYFNNVVAVNTSQHRAINGELKLFAGGGSSLNLELDVFYNFEPREHHRFSLGLGYSGFHDLRIPLALQIYPLQEFKKLSILMELAPGYDLDHYNYRDNVDPFGLRFLWGVRYTFGKD